MAELGTAWKPGGRKQYALLIPHTSRPEGMRIDVLVLDTFIDFDAGLGRTRFGHRGDVGLTVLVGRCCVVGSHVRGRLLGGPGRFHGCRCGLGFLGLGGMGKRLQPRGWVATPTRAIMRSDAVLNSGKTLTVSVL